MCNKEKLYKEFYFQEKINKNGETVYYFYTMCIDCEKARAYQRILNHMDEHREIIKRNNKRPNIIQIKRNFAKKQRESGYFIEYLNKPEVKEKSKEYGKKRRLKNHNITKLEWKACKEYFDNSCAYCGLHQEDHWIKRKGKLINIDLHKEHVDDKGKNDLSNCIPSCQSCNSEKWEFKFDEWYNSNNIKYIKERYDKIQKWLTEDYKKI